VANRKVDLALLSVALTAVPFTTISANVLEDARQAMHDGAFEHAQNLLRPLADTGDSEAQFTLGQVFENSEQNASNAAEAMYYYQLAAEQSHAEAANRLASLSGTQQEIATNDTVVLDWYIEAAEEGDPESQFNLGVVYETGMGVKMDQKEAIKWYRRAANNGHKESQLRYGLLMLSGDSNIRNLNKGEEWLRIAADNGNKVATLFRKTVLDSELESRKITIAKHIREKDVLAEEALIRSLNRKVMREQKRLLAQAEMKTAPKPAVSDTTEKRLVVAASEVAIVPVVKTKPVETIEEPIFVGDPVVIRTQQRPTLQAKLPQTVDLTSDRSNVTTTTALAPSQRPIEKSEPNNVTLLGVGAGLAGLGLLGFLYSRRRSFQPWKPDASEVVNANLVLKVPQVSGIDDDDYRFIRDLWEHPNRSAQSVQDSYTQEKHKEVAQIFNQETQDPLAMAQTAAQEHSIPKAAPQQAQSTARPEQQPNALEKNANYQRSPRSRAGIKQSLWNAAARNRQQLSSGGWLERLDSDILLNDEKQTIALKNVNFNNRIHVKLNHKQVTINETTSIDDITAKPEPSIKPAASIPVTADNQWQNQSSQREQVLYEAQYKTALMFLQGSEVGNNKKLAIKWLFKAANGGHTIARRKLNELYRSDKGLVESVLNEIQGRSKPATQVNAGQKAETLKTSQHAG